MLQEAKELQLNAVLQLCEQICHKDEITFKAPTGSGKTYIMADFMNRILFEDEDVVFIVSSLSKGNLAKQNYDKFCEYVSAGVFPNIKSHLISTEISSEERLFIPTNSNVYVLPRDLYRRGGKLMQGAMEAFLQNITLDKVWGGLGKKIYLIKDECHIATNNLDTLSKVYFHKIINFSATPKLRRGQTPDVEIKESDAVVTKLIKRIEIGSEEDTVADAICKFEEIKERYRNLLGINPCLIIQISNKDNADYELNNIIFPELNKTEHQDLKWMLIVDDDKRCDTNDVLKAKKIPVSKWKDYAKENTSVDIIIFKMVISEGWDIPRACMLYQIRNSKSKQLDEQVMGRVRRNPRLLDFEILSDEAQKLATTAWIWGIVPNLRKKTYGVKLCDEQRTVTNEIKLNITHLKPLTDKKDFDLETFLLNQRKRLTNTNIFDLYRNLSKTDASIKKMCYEYADTTNKWWDFCENIDKIITENNKYNCDYTQSMELVKDECNCNAEVSFALDTSYEDNGNYVNISDWVWCRKDGKSKFSFDSEAECKWASIIKNLSTSDVLGVTPNKAVKKIVIGKHNQNFNQFNLFGEIEPEKINTSDKYLWGKNYLENSEIKFEYYLNGVHASYPDFIMKDEFNRIHIFEVKSVNKSNSLSFDSDTYEDKALELINCYKQASSLTGYLFYLPVMKNDTWQIIQLINGVKRQLTLSEFEKFVKTSPL